MPHPREYAIQTVTVWRPHVGRGGIISLGSYHRVNRRWRAADGARLQDANGEADPPADGGPESCVGATARDRSRAAEKAHPL